VLLSNSNVLIVAFLLCDVVRVVVKHCFKRLRFLFIFAVLLGYNFLTIAYIGAKIVAIWQQSKLVVGICSLRMRRNGYLGASGQKSDPVIRSGYLEFLYDRCISTTEWRLRDIFDVFVLLRRMTL